MTQEFEHFEGREIGQLWRFCDIKVLQGISYRMLRNVASLRKCGDSERTIFLLMIPIFKENGLIWTPLDTSNIPNIIIIIQFWFHLNEGGKGVIAWYVIKCF